MSAEQLVDAAPSGQDCVTDAPWMPFTRLESELDRNGPVREALLEACPMPSASRYRRMRWLLFVALVPVLVLVELDRQLLLASRPGAAAALAADVLIAVAIALDVARVTPRHPAATTAALGATAMRFALLSATRCGHGVHPLLHGLAAIAAVMAVLTAWLSPSPRQLADHLRRALSIEPPTRLPARSTPGYWWYVAYAIAAGAALPLMLFTMHRWQAPVHLQLFAFLLFAWIVPSAGRVRFGREAPPFRRALSAALGLQVRAITLGPRAIVRAVLRVAGASIAALVLCFGLVRGTQSGLETASAIERCVAPEKRDSSLQRFLDLQRVEAASGRHAPTEAPLFFLLTVALVPIAEELVYRGLVQHALRRRLRRRLAIALAALVFGLAHILVYRSVVYQTILLGLGFGLAYEGAGVLASTITHMLWNLWLSF